MRNLREVSVAAPSAKRKFGLGPLKRPRPPVRIEGLTRVILAFAQILSSCSVIRGQEITTPTPPEGQTIQPETIRSERSQIMVLNFGAEGLTPQENDILTAYQQGFQANPFVAESGYVFNNVSVVEVPGTNNNGQISTLEMGITSAQDSNQNEVFFFQFRNDNQAPTPGVPDTSVTTYRYSESNVRMTETPDGIVVDIYGLQMPEAEQDGNPSELVKLCSMVFDSSSPHSTIAELMENGTLLETIITNPISRKSAVIDEGRTPGFMLLDQDGKFVPVSFLRQGAPTGEGTTGEEEVIPTPNAVSSLAPEVQELFDSQQVKYETGDNGSIIIDLYDTTGVEKISPESFQRVDTQDGLNPSILTAKDTEGNTYAYNPEHGWFKVPEVYNPATSFDWFKISQEARKNLPSNPYLDELNKQLYPENYPEITEDFVTDGRLSITVALHYQNLPEDQKISQNAPRGQYWVSYDWGGKILDIGLIPAGNVGDAIINYPEEYENSHYIIDSNYLDYPEFNIPAPFIFGGLWKVRLNTGEYLYGIGTIQKNPTENNPNQLINLLYGFDQEGFETAAKTIYCGRSDLLLELHTLIWGQNQLSIIVRPPEQLPDGSIPPFDVNGGNEYFSFIGPNPTLGSRQGPGELISLFPEEDQAEILRVLVEGFKSPNNINIEAPLNGLPTEFAKRILFARISFR